MKNILIFGLLPLLIFSFPGYTQPSRVEAIPDRDTIRIGEQTIIQLRASVNTGFFCIMPTLGDTLTSAIEVIEQSETDSIQKKDIRDYIRQLTITSFDTGAHTIPAFKFIIYDSLTRDTLQSQPVSFYVQDVAVDTAQAPKDIKPVTIIPAPILPGNYKWMWWLLLLVPVTALVWYLLYRRKQPRQTPVPSAPVIPAHIVALEALQKLDSEKLWQKNQHKAYHSTLTDIVRRYIEVRFNIPALEQTSGAILAMLKYSPAGTDKQLYENLGQLLRLADAVKFAKYIPLAPENEQSMNSARQFIERTSHDQSKKETE